MGQKGLILPNGVAFADLNFRYNTASGGFTIDMSAMLHFCDVNDIDACSVIPCFVDASNPGATAMLERGSARLQALLDHWYTLHCARSGVRDIAYEGWRRHSQHRKPISRLAGISRSLPVQPIS